MEHLITIAESYMKALNTLDEAAYVSLFTSDCLVEDPYGTAKYTGEDGLHKFFSGMLKTWQYFEMRSDSIYPGGDHRLAVRWSASATSKGNKTAEFSGITIFTIEGDKILNLEAYWNLQNMLNQIR